MRANISRANGAGLTHYQVLLTELARNGRVTYAELMARYPDYDKSAFLQAARRARLAGVARLIRHGRISTIEAVGCCPCCGRPLV